MRQTRHWAIKLIYGITAIGAQILADLGLKNIRLLTNNPRKIVGLEGYGLKVVERMPLEVEVNPANYKYLKTKKEKMGHHLNI